MRSKTLPTALLSIVGLLVIAFAGHRLTIRAVQAEAHTTTCQIGGKAKLMLASARGNEQAPPMMANGKPPSTSAPGSMTWIPGGEFSMGSDEAAFGDSRPWHRVYVDGFWMNKTLVTNRQFAKFVRATRYVTVAERKPDPKDYPGASSESLAAGSLVFAPPKQAVRIRNPYQWWSYVPGASWRHPEGSDSNLQSREDHPVVQVAYDDAAAYCSWDGGRLPTEAEFEFAARGGLAHKRYAWGDEFELNGKFMANMFQGHFPDASGFAQTSRCASGYGLVRRNAS